MVAKKNKINKKNSATKLVWYTAEQTFKKVSKNKVFQQAYKEETARIKLAKQIRELRTTSGLTQRVVAQRAGMPQSVIARVEGGEHGLSLETLSKIATVFGKKVQLV